MVSLEFPLKTPEDTKKNAIKAGANSSWSIATRVRRAEGIIKSDYEIANNKGFWQFQGLPETSHACLFPNKHSYGLPIGFDFIVTVDLCKNGYQCAKIGPLRFIFISSLPINVLKAANYIRRGKFQKLPFLQYAWRHNVEVHHWGSRRLFEQQHLRVRKEHPSLPLVSLLGVLRGL